MFSFDAAQVRVQDPKTVPDTFTFNDRFGITDTNLPTDDQIDDHQEGLFSRCVEIRSDALKKAITGGHSMDGFHVRRRTAQGMFEDVERSHPWVRLLKRPNDNRAAGAIWKWAGKVRDYRGSADFVVDHNNMGTPVNIYEIYPEFGELRLVPDDVGGVEGYIFQRNDGERLQLGPNDILRLPLSDVTSPYKTVSLLEALAYELDKTLYADIYERDQLKDGRYPPAYISTEQRTTKEQREQAGQEFKNKYLGADQEVKGVPVLGKGMSIEQTSFTAEDLALIETRRLNDQHILWICGVPEGLVNHAANRASAQEQRKSFAQDTVQPMVDLIAEQLTHQFRQLFGSEENLVIQAPDVVPVDGVEQARIDRMNLQTGKRTMNEVRRRDGLEPYEVEEADQPHIPSTQVPVGSQPTGSF